MEHVNARKIPQLRALLTLGQLLAAVAQAVAAQEPDTAALFQAAKRGETTYEMTILKRAPLVLGSASAGRDCDEIIGRYCVWFDDEPGDTLVSEPTEIRIARDTAIARIGRASTLAPGRPNFAYPLVRLLVEADRTAEAVEVARAYARARNHDSASAMLLGFAYFHDRQIQPALDSFDRWISALPSGDRKRISDLGWLISQEEERRYRRLLPDRQARYEERAWRYADPLYVTPGNELRADHLARHAFARMMAERGHYRGRSWGRDDEQLAVRFGPMVRTTRSWRSGSIGSTDSQSDHWAPNQRQYFAPRLTAALAMPERLDTIWPLDSLGTRSSHAPATIRLMRVLEGQHAVFGDTLLYYGVARVDTLVKDTRAEFFLLDSALNATRRSVMDVSIDGDSALVKGTLSLPASADFYSAEIYDPVSRFAARARYKFENTAGRRLSGILLAHPFEAGRLPAGLDSPLLRPLTRPVVTSGDRIGLYAELSRRPIAVKTEHVELELKGLSRGSAITRAAGWIGRSLGVVQARAPARFGWDVELNPSLPTPVAITLDVGVLKPGLYRVTMKVTDEAGRDIVASRDFLVISRNSSSPRP